jgi:hypothetical protein
MDGETREMIRDMVRAKGLEGGARVIDRLIGCGIETARELVTQAVHPAEGELAADYAEGLGEPFCACGRRTSQCDHSRTGCRKPTGLRAVQS